MKPPRNVIYIHSHDTGRYISPYGHALPTPNLQRFAGRGVTFRQAFCANPTCSPSRACLLTGQYAHNNGMFGLAHAGGRLNDPTHLLPWFLHNHGYHTVLAGLQHIRDRRDTDGMDRYGYTHDLTIDSAFESVDDRDTKTAERAAAFLAERGTDTGNEKPPFFLDVGFYTTHRTGPVEPGSKVAGHNAPDWPLGDPRFVDVPPCLPDVPDVRKDFADYAEAVGRLDGYIGTVLGALDDAQLTDQTLVIITTDHGIAFPWMKCNLTAHGTGVMLLMAGPDQFRGGRVVDDAVSHLDVFPTVCDVLGLEHPDWLQGESTLPLLADDHTRRDRPIFAEVNYHARREPMRSVRTRRFSYIRRLDPLDHTVLGNIDDSLTKLHLHECKAFDPPPPAEQLFDLLHDPHERSDVADDPDYAPALAEMRERIDAWMHETNDIALQGPIDLPGYPTKATDTYSP